MSFKRTGTPVKVNVIDKFDDTTQTAIVCPDCKSVLGFESNKLIKLGNAVFVGTKNLFCAKCNKEVKK